MSSLSDLPSLPAPEVFIKTLSAALNESIRIKEGFVETNIRNFLDVSRLMTQAVINGNKIMACGNGGSATDASHFVGEIVGRFKIERPGLPAISLGSDLASVTAIANDYGYEEVFSRQAQALARAGDLLFAISTSGESPNVLKAVKSVHHHCTTIALTGRPGSTIALASHHAFECPVTYKPISARIQETHIFALHLLVELMDNELRERGYCA